VNTTVKIT